MPPVRVLRKRNQANHPALSAVLLGEFLRKLEAVATINEQTRIAMLLVVLTACRKAEVIGARWSEFDLNAAEWEVPADRMKAGRAHWVALSGQAIRLLEALRSMAPTASEFLFPNRDDYKRPMADRSLNALMERLGFSGDGTPHGMRAAFSAHFNGAGANVDVIEHCLAHVPNNRVRAPQVARAERQPDRLDADHRPTSRSQAASSRVCASGQCSSTRVAPVLSSMRTAADVLRLTGRLAATKPLAGLPTDGSQATPSSRACQRRECAHQLDSARSATPLAEAHSSALFPEARYAATCSRKRCICCRSMFVSLRLLNTRTQSSKLGDRNER